MNAAVLISKLLLFSMYSHLSLPVLYVRGLAGEQTIDSLRIFVLREARCKRTSYEKSEVWRSSHQQDCISF